MFPPYVSLHTFLHFPAMSSEKTSKYKSTLQTVSFGFQFTVAWTVLRKVSGEECAYKHIHRHTKHNHKHIICPSAGRSGLHKGLCLIIWFLRTTDTPTTPHTTPPYPIPPFPNRFLYISVCPPDCDLHF